MPSNWNNLSREILDKIFSHVVDISKKTVAQCAMTCRHWRAPAQTLLFSAISLRSIQDNNDLSLLLLANAELGKRVKTLQYIDDYEDNTSSLLAADLQFPNLQKIELQGTARKSYVFCMLLIEKGAFENLEVLPEPTNEYQDGLYSKCLDMLKGRIASITLFDDELNNRVLYKNLNSKLDTFPKLKDIYIRVPISDLKFENVAKYVQPILEGNLVSLQELKITCAVDDTIYFCLSTDGKNTLTSAAKLKSLYLRMHNKTSYTTHEQLMTYIMEQFPNLDNFIVKNSGKLLENSNTPLSPTFLQFLIYLSKVTKFDFPKVRKMGVGQAIQLVENFYSTVEKNKSVPALPSRALILKIRELNSQVGFVGMNFLSINSEKSHLMKFDVACKRKPANEGVNEEPLQLIEGIGRFFDSIIVNITSSANLVVLLNHITSHCTKAHALYIDSTDTSPSEDSPAAFKKEFKKSSGIKNLTFAKHMPKPDLLLYTLAHLPCLETLSLVDSFTKKDSSWNRHYLIHLPHVSLQRLNIEVNRNGNGAMKKEGVHYIKLVTDTESKPRYCFFTAVYTASQKTFLGYNTIENPTESVYQASILDPRYSTYLIYCKSVEKFTFKYISAENGYYRTLDLCAEPSSL